MPIKVMPFDVMVLFCYKVDSCLRTAGVRKGLFWCWFGG
jgi:hypothetical protein